MFQNIDSGDEQMLGRLSIATKVFGLAVFLPFLTVSLAVFLLWHVSSLQDEMDFIAKRLHDAVPEAKLKLCESFLEVLAAYGSQKCDIAQAALQICLKLASEDGPSRLFMERIQFLRFQLPGVG
jgi:hypothetical protein